MKRSNLSIIVMTITCEHFSVNRETVPGSNFQLILKSCNWFIGNNSLGDMCYWMYQEKNMDTSCIRRSEKILSKGVCLIYMDSGVENEIVIDLATNLKFSHADIKHMIPRIMECSLVLMQLKMKTDIIIHETQKCK